MSNKDTQPVLFTQRQYEFLNKLFPERSASGMSNDELRFYSGQRSMVMFVRDKVQKGQS